MQALSGGASGPSPTDTGLKKPPHENKPDAETILYVEDESVLRGVISDCLSQLGYQVLSAASAHVKLTPLRS
mgnify:CR=1 FL=1